VSPANGLEIAEHPVGKPCNYARIFPSGCSAIPQGDAKRYRPPGQH
jgi:hypothetical protein